MHASLYFALLGSLAIVAAVSPPRNGDPDVSNRFIVKLKPHASVNNVAAFLNTYQSTSPLESIDENQIDHEYDAIFPGFAGKFSHGFLSALHVAHPEDIEYVVPDGVVHAFAPTNTQGSNGQSEQASPPSWGLTRVSERKLDLKQPYVYPNSAGAGVDVFVVDTGVWFNHTDFGGRAEMVASFIDGEGNPSSVAINIDILCRKSGFKWSRNSLFRHHCVKHLWYCKKGQNFGRQGLKCLRKWYMVGCAFGCGLCCETRQTRKNGHVYVSGWRKEPGSQWYFSFFNNVVLMVLFLDAVNAAVKVSLLSFLSF